MKSKLFAAFVGAVVGVVLAKTMWGHNHRGAETVSQSEAHDLPGIDNASASAASDSEPLYWPSIENANFHQLAANLRRVGCPESTLEAIIKYRATYAFRERIRKLQNPMYKHWSTSSEIRANEKAISDILLERSSLFDSLGFASPQNPLNTPKSVTKTSQFSAEKLQQIADVTAKYPNQLLSMSATKEEVEQFFANRKARYDILSQALTPEELIDYRIENDSNAKALAIIMRPLNLTDAEFRKIALVMDFSEVRMVNGRFSTEIEEALRQGLGKERYLEYREAYAPGNAGLNRFIMQDHTPPDEISQLRAIRQSNLSPEQLRQAVTQLLGDKRASQYLNMTQQHRVP